MIELAMALLGAVVAIAPGLLSGLSGHASDEAFLSAARNAIERIPAHPAASAIAAVRARDQQVTQPDFNALRAHVEVAKVTLIAGPLRTREREAIEALVKHAERA